MEQLLPRTSNEISHTDGMLECPDKDTHFLSEFKACFEG